jgi:hypothetical protein
MRRCIGVSIAVIRCDVDVGIVLWPAEAPARICGLRAGAREAYPTHRVSAQPGRCPDPAAARKFPALSRRRGGVVTREHHHRTGTGGDRSASTARRQAPAWNYWSPRAQGTRPGDCGCLVCLLDRLLPRGAACKFCALFSHNNTDRVYESFTAVFQK